MTELARGLRDGAAALDIGLDDQRVAALMRYAELLREWNTRLNLVADAGAEAVLHKHLLDSLTVLAALRQAGVGDDAPLADIGTGAGLPGLVLKLATLERPVTLIESLKKKAAFLEAAADDLALEGLTVLAERVEVIGQEPVHRGQYGAVTARRLAELNTLLEYALPLLAVGGAAVLPKGEGLEGELAAARGVAELLGGTAPELVTVPTPWDHGERRFVVVRKRAPTPEAYPRAIGRPTKRPLRVQE